MEEQLTGTDLSIIIESLEYTRHNFENYQGYPSYEFKIKQLDRVNEVLNKVRSIRKAAKEK